MAVRKSHYITTVRLYMKPRAEAEEHREFHLEKYTFYSLNESILHERYFVSWEKEL